MKIAIFTDTYFPQVNGVAKTLYRFTNYLEQNQQSYQIYSPTTNNYPAMDSSQPFPSFPFFFYPECRTVIANPKKIESSLQAFQPDIIHIATPYMMGLYGLFAAKKLMIPVVSSYHTHFDQYLKYYHASWLSPLLWKYLKWFHQSTETIFVPSQETLNKLQSFGFDSLHIWGRGIDCDLFQPSHLAQTEIRKRFNIEEEFILLYVGRLAPEKDLQTLARVMDNLSSEMNSRIHWVLVGDGPNKKEWEEKAKEQGNLTVTGYIKGEELANIYAAADLFVFPSFTETFGNVVLEALACGTPAIVANQGGVTEIVHHQKTGIICERENELAFSMAICELLLNNGRRTEMGMEARKYALSQSWDRIFHQLVNGYEEVINDTNQWKQKYA